MNRFDFGQLTGRHRAALAKQRCTARGIIQAFAQGGFAGRGLDRFYIYKPSFSRSTLLRFIGTKSSRRYDARILEDSVSHYHFRLSVCDDQANESSSVPSSNRCGAEIMAQSLGITDSKRRGSWSSPRRANGAMPRSTDRDARSLPSESSIRKTCASTVCAVILRCRIAFRACLGLLCVDTSYPLSVSGWNGWEGASTPYLPLTFSMLKINYRLPPHAPSGHVGRAACSSSLRGLRQARLRCSGRSIFLGSRRIRIDCS